VRVIVCGCRDWADPNIISVRLNQLVSAKGPLMIVHGACPTGADYYASRFANSPMGHCIEERHPADWSRGPSAGPARNLRMAELGADLCLAFWDGCSAGTLDMIRRAVAHGISVRIVPKNQAR